ncbi:hypothetical protein [Acinetobacter bereziniae]|uniref:hypothetical protein n=1 Tax=Acinetobacter bereziniae TaxID=106648 RepID=UPI001116784A|nr:hypothetical protein [Acinetobacter bereziniae]TNL48282.1 hypothetical protein EYY58_22215 [Acinetobacter bereziniae]
MAEAADVTSIVGWLATGGLIVWVTAFITLRKDDRSVVIDNVTKERKEWRASLRNWSAEVSSLALTDKWCVHNYLRLRSDLVTRLNPNNKYDIDVINVFDQLSPGNEGCKINVSTLISLQEKVGCLLKQDWERVKYVESMPFYMKYISINKSKKEAIYRKNLYLNLGKPYREHQSINISRGNYINRVILVDSIIIIILVIIFIELIFLQFWIIKYILLFGLVFMFFCKLIIDIEDK